MAFQYHKLLLTLPILLSLTFSASSCAGTQEDFDDYPAPPSAAASAGSWIIHVNQVGYERKDKEKWAIVEGATTSYGLKAQLQRWTGAEWRTVLSVDSEAQERRWNRWFRRFDFSKIGKKGVYRIVFGNSTSVAFKIGKGIIKGLHSDTLDKFLPLQMCHIDVAAGKVGHGTCHLDDGSQVARGKEGPDFYQAFWNMEPDTAPAGSHITANAGGWHDAGDYDVNVGSTSYTVLILSWAQELYGEGSDNYRVDRTNRRLVRQRNGIPDLAEQIQWGATWLLSMQNGSGRLFTGVVVNSKKLYGLEKAPDKITDGLLGTGDEREIFTNTVAPNQLKFAAAAAAASRALRRYDRNLSSRLREGAEAAWDYYSSHNPPWVDTVYNRNVSVGQKHMILAAAAELFRTTGDGKYLKAITKLRGCLEDIKLTHPNHIIAGSNWNCLPFLAQVDNLGGDMGQLVKNKIREWVRDQASVENANIFGVRVDFLNSVWGNSSDMLNVAVVYAILHGEYKSAVPGDRVGRYLNWVLGLHPGPDYSFVTGLGACHPVYPHSALLSAVYGNKPGGIDGGVVPGLVLDGNNPVFRDDRELWDQTEYTTESAAAFIFVSLAARSR